MAFQTVLTRRGLRRAVTGTGAVQGAAIGALIGTLTNDFTPPLPTPSLDAALNAEAMASLKQTQALVGGPLVQAWNFAVMTGVNAGISCVMKRLMGKEDVQSSMAAVFGSGAMFSLVGWVAQIKFQMQSLPDYSLRFYKVVFIS